MRGAFSLLLVCAFLLAPASALAEVDRSSLATLTSLVTIALSESGRFEVVSSSDVREVIALEAERQAMGCESDASCLAEVAGAIGARFVVFGQLGKLGSLYVLTLNLFDSDAATAASRVVTKGETLESLAEQVDDAVRKLVHQGPKDAPAAGKHKALVLDLKPASGEVAPATGAAAAPPPDQGSFPWLLVTGSSAAGLGVAALIIGGVLGGVGVLVIQEAEAAQYQSDAIRLRDEANEWGLAANVSFVVGGGLVLAGGAVAALELLGGGEE